MKLQEYLPYYRRNLKVAFPVMLTQLGASLVGLVDSVMVGHYATADLAAVSFSNAIFFTVMVFSMGCLMGITPLIGYEEGQKQVADPQNHNTAISQLLQNGIWFTLLLSAAMLLLLGSCIPFLDRFGQEPVVIEAARPYYWCIVISIVPFLFFFLAKQFLEGLGNTMAAMIISIGMNVLNVLLNWMFIFGHCGLEPMGAKGAGIATLISRTIMPICFIVVIWIHKDWRRYLQLFKWKHNQWLVIRRLWSIGSPIGVQTMLETVTFTFSFIIIGWISKEALAAHQVANQIADLTFMLALGIGSATTIRVSHQLGTGSIHAVRMASNASIHLVLAMNTIGAALMISLRHYIPHLFTQDEAVLAIAPSLILLAGLFQYADGLQCVGAAMLRGITDVKMPMVYAFIAYILIALPVGLLCTFALHMGANGMWVGFIFGLSIAAILFHTRYRKKLKELDQKFANTK